MNHHMKRLIFIAAILAPAFSVRAAEKPNIVFIITDDQAIDTIAAGKMWGADKAALITPHFDALYNNGTVFRQAYNMGAWHGAVCVASRSMLLTGRSVWKTAGEEKQKFAATVASQKTWSQRMKRAGYTTYLTGKWHVSTDAKAIFDHTVHIRPGMPGTVASSYDRPADGKPDKWHADDPKHGGFWEGGKHWSEVLADDAADFVKQAAAERKPFFMYLAFNAPHDPRQAPREWLERYPVAAVPVPENFMAIHPHRALMGLEEADGKKVMRDEKLAPFPRTNLAVRTHRREYYAMVSHADAQVGRILTALEQAGLKENTIVIFTADHGLAIGRHGLFGKQNMYEHSLRVPFVISGPGIPQGKVIDERIYLQDAVATSLALAGADPSDLDFKSVLPLIEGKASSHYDAIYGAFTEKKQRAVISGNHKLILYPEGKVAEVYDLAADPLEKSPLPDNAESKAIKLRLFAALAKLQQENKDPLDLKAIYPEWMP
jgi:arylsulfatase A-like enzyme